MVRMYRKRDLASPLSEFLGVTVMVTIMWYGSRLIFSGTSGLKAEEFIAYLALFSQIIPPAKAITTAWYNVKKGVASAERVRAILESPELITDAEDAKPINVFKEAVSRSPADVKPISMVGLPAAVLRTRIADPA